MTRTIPAAFINYYKTNYELPLSTLSHDNLEGSKISEAVFSELTKPVDQLHSIHAAGSTISSLVL